MTPKTKKVIAVVVVILIVIAIGWYLLKPSNTWVEMPGKDVVPGPNIESRPSGTVDEDKKYADTIKAVAFFRLDGTTWFKSAKTPVTVSSQNGAGTLFVKG